MAEQRVTRSKKKIEPEIHEQLSWNLGITRPIVWPKNLNRKKVSVICRTLEADKDPDIHEMFRQFNIRFFNGEVRFVLRKTSFGRTRFGFTDLTNHEINLVMPNLRNQARSVLVRALIHEMIHAYLDKKGACRKENMDHGNAFQQEVRRVNRLANCNIEDDKDVNWPLVEGKYNYVCNKCNVEIRRTVKRPPFACDQRFYMHRNICNGQFELREESND